MAFKHEYKEGGILRTLEVERLAVRGFRVSTSKNNEYTILYLSDEEMAELILYVLEGE